MANKSNREIERKFHVREYPVEYYEHSGTGIIQGYAADGFRFREEADAVHTRTRKSGTGIDREEIEERIPADEFRKAFAETEGRRIKKLRTRVHLPNGLTAEIDDYLGHLTGFRTVEVEFQSVDEANAFVPPEWFGVELTGDRRFANSSMAARGLPDDWEDVIAAAQG